MMKVVPRWLSLLRLGLPGALAALLALAGCSSKPLHWDLDHLPGMFPNLRFDFISADTGKPVTEADFRGKVVALYFGYTHCPDICPLTMSDLATALGKLGPLAKDVRIVFISVDPARDTLPILKAYTHAFSPEAIGLRGTMPEVDKVTARYHVAFSYGPKDKDGNYVVNHSSGVYIFDQKGRVELLGSEVDSPEKFAHDLRQLIQH